MKLTGKQIRALLAAGASKKTIMRLAMDADDYKSKSKIREAVESVQCGLKKRRKHNA